METQEAELVEDNSKRDNRGRRISDPQRIVELIGAYESSGLTQRQFCRRECINYHTFVAWLGKHRRSGAPVSRGNQSPQLRELVIGEGKAKRNRSTNSCETLDVIVILDFHVAICHAKSG